MHAINIITKCNYSIGIIDNTGHEMHDNVLLFYKIVQQALSIMQTVQEVLNTKRLIAINLKEALH